MIGIVSVNEYNDTAIECLTHILNVYNQEFTFIYHPFSLQYLKDQIVEYKCTKILLCGKETLKLFFKVKKLEDAEMVQLWNELPYFYTQNPNDINKSPDNFRTLHDYIDFMVNCKDAQISIPPIPQYEYINNVQMLALMIADIRAIEPKYIVLDIETSGLNLLEDFIRLVGIAVTPYRMYIIPAVLLKNSEAIKLLKSVMEDETLNWCGHGANSFDAVWLRHYYGINIKFIFDTLLAHYCIDERQGIHSLDRIAASYFYIQTWKNMVQDYARTDEVTLANYLALDLHFQFRLIEEVNGELQNNRLLEQVHDKILIPASYVFGKSEEHGIKLDIDYLERLDERHKIKIEELSEELYEKVGHEVNVQSWQQVSNLLYDELELTKCPSTKSSPACTDEFALVMLNNEVADKILELRRYQNINGLYVKGLLDKVDVDGYIRPNYNIHGTETGRLSCSKPNLFNIPSPYHDWYNDDFDIKSAFVARPGYTLIEADESQIELRITAWYSYDEFLLNAYANNLDIHTLVATMCYHLPAEQITKKMRSAAKKIDFGAIYSIGAKSLMEQLMLMKIFYTKEEVKEFQKDFLGQLKGFNRWKLHQYEFVRVHHYVETPLGRRRRFPYLTERNFHAVKRQAVNTPIQSLAADIVTTSIIELDNQLPEDSKIHFSVYDSILLEIPDNLISESLLIVQKVMTEKDHIIENRVPFAVDIKTGKSWGDMKELII